VGKATSIVCTGKAIICNANLPYSGKRGNNWADSEQREKRTVLRAFLAWVQVEEGKKEPV